MRIAGIVIVAATFLAVPFALQQSVSPHRELRLTTLLLPSLASLLAWPLLRRSRYRGAVAIWAWCGVFGASNAANLCKPGWCGTYGFPLPYSRWSDSVMTFNGQTPDTFYEMSLVFDVLVFIVVTAALVRWVRNA